MPRAHLFISSDFSALYLSFTAISGREGAAINIRYTYRPLCFCLSIEGHLSIERKPIGWPQLH